MNKLIEYMLKPILEAEFNKGFSAGVNAEKLVKANDDTRREYDILRRGKILGREELIKELETQIEEISAEEFEEISKLIEEPQKTKPFGFVGSIENMELILND